MKNLEESYQGSRSPLRLIYRDGVIRLPLVISASIGHELSKLRFNSYENDKNGSMNCLRSKKSTFLARHPPITYEMRKICL